MGKAVKKDAVVDAKGVVATTLGTGYVPFSYSEETRSTQSSQLISSDKAYPSQTENVLMSAISKMIASQSHELVNPTLMGWPFATTSTPAKIVADVLGIATPVEIDKATNKYLIAAHASKHEEVRPVVGSFSQSPSIDFEKEAHIISKAMQIAKDPKQAEAFLQKAGIIIKAGILAPEYLG